MTRYLTYLSFLYSVMRLVKDNEAFLGVGVLAQLLFGEGGLGGESGGEEEEAVLRLMLEGDLARLEEYPGCPASWCCLGKGTPRGESARPR